MPRLVHIAPLSEAAKIRRNGLQPTRLKNWVAGHDRFLWAFPVLKSYTLTHQWARELKRWGRTALSAIHFEIPDQETVLVRHYRTEPLPMTAAEAVGVVLAQEDPRGFEIIVPRRIEPKEIVTVKPLPRAVGWRYWPGSKNLPMMMCDCPMCMPRGEVKAARYRQRVKAEMARRGLGSNA